MFSGDHRPATCARVPATQAPNENAPDFSEASARPKWRSIRQLLPELGQRRDHVIHFTLSVTDANDDIVLVWVRIKNARHMSIVVQDRNAYAQCTRRNRCFRLFARFRENNILSSIGSIEKNDCMLSSIRHCTVPIGDILQPFSCVCNLFMCSICHGLCFQRRRRGLAPDAVGAP